MSTSRSIERRGLGEGAMSGHVHMASEDHDHDPTKPVKSTTRHPFLSYSPHITDFPLLIQRNVSEGSHMSSAGTMGTVDTLTDLFVQR